MKKSKFFLLATVLVVIAAAAILSWRGSDSLARLPFSKSFFGSAAEKDEHSGSGGHPDHVDHDEPEPVRPVAVAGGSESEHGHQHEEEAVELSDAELEEFGIELATAGPGPLGRGLEFPGEIVLNSDRLAHVVPRVPGIVREARVKVGERVGAGQLLAILESRELATARTAYLDALEREKLARADFHREERLWRKQVTSEQEYLKARQVLAAARIAVNGAAQHLRTLGCPETEIVDPSVVENTAFSRYRIRAPFAATVIEKHITSGENVAAYADLFTLADFSTVWVNIDIYQKDLVRIHPGQRVTVEAGHGIPPVAGEIAWISPRVDETTRTVRARIELANPDGILRPGLFVTARVAMEAGAAVVVPGSALQTLADRSIIFVRDEDGFEPRPVVVGRKSADAVEIVSGLEPGQVYVSKGAFTLKAHLGKGQFGDGHNH